MEAFIFLFMLIVVLSLYFMHGKLNRIEKKLEKLSLRSSETVKTPVKLQAANKADESPLELPDADKKQIAPPKKKEVNKNWQNFKYWLFYGTAVKETSKEYAAATAWLTRLGIIILLCAVGFFLKYSIENNLINPTVRIICTFIAGMVMYCGGLYGLQKRFHILSVGILTAGIVTLYMGAFAGFKLYALLPVWAAFVLMVLTTVISMLTAVRKNILPVALTGCTGAYLTPIMLSNGCGNLPFLFAYTVLVSAGILIAARVYRWRSLEITAFVLSFFLISAGNMEFLSHTNSLTANILCPLAILLNFCIFTSIPLIRKKDSAIGLEECLLPVGAAAFALLNGIPMLMHILQYQYEKIGYGAYALVVTAVTLSAGIILKNKRHDSDKLLPAFIASSVFSLGMVPVLVLRTSGSLATAWALLGFALAFICGKVRYKTLVILSLTAFAAAFAAAINFPHCQFVYSTVLKRFFHLGVLALLLLAAGRMIFALEEKIFKKVRNFFLLSGGILMLVYTSIEVFHNLENSTAWYNFRHGGLSVWWALAAVGLLIAGIRKNYKVLRISSMLLFIGCLFKVYIIDIARLNTLHKVVAFLIIALLFLGGATSYIICRKRFQEDKK